MADIIPSPLLCESCRQIPFLALSRSSANELFADDYLVFFWTTGTTFGVRLAQQQYFEQTLQVIDITKSAIGTAHKTRKP